MAPTLRTDARGVHVWHIHDDARHLRGVQIDLTIVKFLGRIIKAANNVTAQGPTLHRAIIFRETALATTVERRHSITHRYIAQLVNPVTRTARVTMKHQHGGVGRTGIFWAQQLGMDACTAHARKVHVKTFCIGRLEGGRHQFDFRIDGVHFGQTAIPKVIKIIWAGVGALVSLQLFVGHIKQ